MKHPSGVRVAGPPVKLARAFAGCAWRRSGRKASKSRPAYAQGRMSSGTYCKCEQTRRRSRNKPRVPKVAASRNGRGGVGSVSGRVGRCCCWWCGDSPCRPAPESPRRRGAGVRRTRAKNPSGRASDRPRSMYRIVAWHVGSACFAHATNRRRRFTRSETPELQLLPQASSARVIQVDRLRRTGWVPGGAEILKEGL